MKPLAAVVVYNDGGLWADHNMPCAICTTRHAVYDCQEGWFAPCWACQSTGWQTTQRRSWRSRLARIPKGALPE